MTGARSGHDRLFGDALGSRAQTPMCWAMISRKRRLGQGTGGPPSILQLNREASVGKEAAVV